MPDSEERPTSAPRPPIAWSTGAVPFAYVPGRALVRGEPAAEHLNLIADRTYKRDIGEDDEAEDGEAEDGEAEDGAWRRLEADEEPSVDDNQTLADITLARADGFDVQPDHVFFAHGCDECGCGPHPSLTFDVDVADPYRANPHRANPHRANPHRPIRTGPIRTGPIRTGPIRRSRRPFPRRSEHFRRVS